MINLKQIAVILITLIFVGCKKEVNSTTSTVGSENLYFSFSSPDWSEHIDCSRLSLDATFNQVLSAQSQSTKEIFYLITPSDSSEWIKTKNISKFPIGTDSEFQFNQTLPLSKGATERMMGVPGLSGSSYNSITSIKYAYSEASGAYFYIKGNYRMWMQSLSNNPTKKFVSGSYCFKVKTSRK